MSKLPQTGDLPHSAEGYEPARVEEAFSEFAERVRELESVAAALHAELETLRAERAAPVPFEDEAWPNVGQAPSPDWVASVPAPFPRTPPCRASSSKLRSCCSSASSPASPTSLPRGSCS